MNNNHSMLPGASLYVTTNINDLAEYARILSQYHYITTDQRRCFLSFAYGLENVRNKWQNGIGRCLLRSDSVVLYNFGNLLTVRSINHYFSHHSIYDRLAKFWLYIRNIPDNVAAEVVTGDRDSPSYTLNFEKLRAAKESSSLMINMVIDRNYSNNNNLLLLDIPTILLTVIIRSEAHEYTLGKILERAKSVTKNQIDIPDLLSVVGKEPKRQIFRPDTRAIRDATAHAKFRIRSDSMGDFIINFNNTEDGYSFQRSFTRKELLQFYQDYDRMTIIYTRLLTIRLLYSFLNMNFVTR